MHTSVYPYTVQEHCSYISGFRDLRIDYVCDPYRPSLDKAVEIINQFSANRTKDSRRNEQNVTILFDEDELLQHASNIDLLVIASPNYLHTASLLKWGRYDITILVEKPVAVSREQHDMLRDLMSRDDFRARVWVAMEYRFMPAVAKLLQLLPRIGDIKMVRIHVLVLQSLDVYESNQYYCHPHCPINLIHSFLLCIIHAFRLPSARIGSPSCTRLALGIATHSRQAIP